MNWYQEINKLIILNNNKEDLGIINYINRSESIKYFYDNQKYIYAVVKYCPSMIAFVKEQTYELALMAIKKYCLCINYINSDILDISLILEAIDCSIPKYYYNFQKSQLFFNIIKEKKDFVKDINENIITKDISDFAFKYFDYWIAHIPKKYLTIDICISGLNKHYENIKYIDIFFQTKEMFDIIKNDITSNYFKYINPKFQTLELCLKMIDEDSTIIKYIRKDLLTNKLLMNALNNSEHAFKYIDNNSKTFEMCKLMAEKYGHLLFIPEQYLTNEIYILALKKDINNIVKIKFELQTKEMIDIIINTINNNKHYSLLYILKNINPNLQTYELSLLCIKKNIYLFKYINKKNHTKELIDLVLSQDSNLIRYVKNIEYLKNIWNTQNIELDECIVCGNNKKYFTRYKCKSSNIHFVCFDCKEDKCYYKCLINNDIDDILYNNLNVKFDFFGND